MGRNLASAKPIFYVERHKRDVARRSITARQHVHECVVSHHIVVKQCRSGV